MISGRDGGPQDGGAPSTKTTHFSASTATS